MNGKVLDYYIALALLVSCIVFGIVGGVWGSLQGHHPLLALGIGCLCFIISLGIVLICCSAVGLSFDIIAKFWKIKKPADDGHNNDKPLPKEAATVQPTLDLASSNSVQQRKIKHKDELKTFFRCLIETVIAEHLDNDDEAHILFQNFCNVIDNGDVNEANLQSVKNNNLSNEDLFHLGFILKYYLKKDNDFGATFIYKVFADEFRKGDGVEYNVVRSKLTSNEAQSHFIVLPPSRLRDDGGRSKSVASDGDFEADLKALLG